MCGIFGAVYTKNPQAVAVEAALTSIHHRGPDAQGIYRGQDVVFGHARLAILDLTDAGAQPMVSEDKQEVLVFNGEIYNHHELRRELRSLGATFRSRSDTEVILEGYRIWGDDVVRRLDGMFAIGIFDHRRRRLLLARDRCGKKPLFVWQNNSEVRFASEAKAIFASGIPAEVEPEALPVMLALGYNQPPRTMYRGVVQLEPATLAVYEEGKAPVTKRYWRAPFAEKPLDIPEKEAERELRRLVEAAVVRRLEADVPLGAFLSGGVDSSIIVGVMSRAMDRPVKTFSIGFRGDARYDETHYARLVARHFGTEHVEFKLEPSSFDLVERLVELHDGPFGDSSAIPTSVVSMLTKKHVTVALTGDGGDELFCGYARFLAAEAVEALPSFLLWPGEKVSRFLPESGGERRLLPRARRLLKVASLPLADRIVGWNSFFAFELQRLLRPEWVNRVPISEPLEWNRSLFDHTKNSSALTKVLAHNFESYLPYDLLVKADRASMAHSLEVRSPFLDTALIEFASRLPNRFVRRGLNTKRILKNAFADILPPEILTRGKMGFGIPLGTWFASDLRGYIEDRFQPGAAMYEYVDPSYVREIMNAHFDRRADHGHRLWLLLTLEIWLQSLVKSQAKAPEVRAVAAE